MRLHPTVKAAEEELRARRDSLVKQGYRVTYGTLGRRILVLAKDDERVAIGVDKPRRRRGYHSSSPSSLSYDHTGVHPSA